MNSANAIEYRKACECPSGTTATAGRVVMHNDTAPDGRTLMVRATLYPGPVCNACDAPWERVGWS